MPTEGEFFGLSGFVWLRIFFVLAVAIFCWRMFQLYRLLRLGGAEGRFDHLVLRTVTFFKEVMGQARMFSEPVIGWAHPVIFWGFCLFVIASNLMLIGGMFPQLPIPQAEQIPVLGTLIDLFAVVVMIGLIAAAIRRFIFTPPGLQVTWDASLILVLIGGLMITYLLAEAATIQAGHATWLPAGAATLWLLTAGGVGAESIALIGHVSWWIHALILLAFLVYLPYSKHMHLLWAPAAVFFAELPHKGMLPPAPEQEEGKPAKPLAPFTWRMVLGAYSCAECGRCERSCPAFNSGSQLSPRELSHHFKEFVMQYGFAALRGKVAEGDEAKPHITSQMLWGCTTCYACMERCPVRNEHVPLIVQMRRKLVEDGDLDPNLQVTLEALQRKGNSLGKSARQRFAWAKGLDPPLKNAEKEPVDVLWFLGDYAAFHPSSANASKLVAEVFQAAGMDFGVLLKGEKSTGNDIRRVGEEGLFEMLAEQNMQAMGKAEFNRIMTTDPHSYHALKHEYGAFGLDKPVLHYTEVLDEYLLSGKLSVKNRLSGKVVYHDPCYLGRINGIYEPPRRILRTLGLDVVEMSRTRDNSYCCGAGGGKIWMEEEEGVEERPAVNRMREAVETDGASLFVVACPKDLGMFEDAIKTLGAEDRMRVVDLGELVYEATVKAEAPEPQPVG